MNGYICTYNGKRWETYAETLYDAKKAAVAYWKVSKKNAWKVSATLAEKKGEPVEHIADF